MKMYRDPETGKVFDKISAALCNYCESVVDGQCTDCAFADTDTGCGRFAMRHPEAAALRMGMEIIDDSSTGIDERPTDAPTVLDDTPTGESVKQKPRLAEVLGVEVEERFQVDGAAGEFWVESDGGVKSSWTSPAIPPITRYILYAINHPESIIRAPRLTEPEIAIMRAVGAKFAFLNPGECFITLSVSKPKWDDKYGRWMFTGECVHTHDPVCKVRDTLFSSVRTGDCLPSPYTS